MDQDPLVIESGRRLIEALNSEGFEVPVAFWAWPTEAGRWFLYLGSPVVDEEGPAEAYRRVFGLLRRRPDPWLDPLDIRVLGLNDSLTGAALTAIRRPGKPYPGITRFGSSTLGGLGIDGAYLYPPPSPVASP